MMLAFEDIARLFEGSAYYACGGGVPPASAAKLLSSLGGEMSLCMKPLEEFGGEDVLCTVYAIGAAGAAKKNYAALVVAFDLLEKHIGQKIAGVIPGEIGSEINAVWVAHHRRIPLVDSDMVGGRAVPEEQMDIHSIGGYPTTPVVVVNDQGDVLTVGSARNAATLEAVYRAFAVASGGYCYVAGRPMNAQFASKILPSRTISAALTLGARIRACSTESDLIAAVEECCGSMLLATGCIVELVKSAKAGFNAGTIRINGSGRHEGHGFEVFYQNENLVLVDGSACLCSVPDLITVVDSATLRPIHSSLLNLGAEVLVFGTPALPIWQTKPAREVFNPSHFGLSYEHVPLSTATMRNGIAT